MKNDNSSKQTREELFSKWRKIYEQEGERRRADIPQLNTELETPSSLIRDKKKNKTFVRSAAHRSRTSFDIVVTKPKKPKK